jgi:hypothetical protein
MRTQGDSGLSRRVRLVQHHVLNQSIYYDQKMPDRQLFFRLIFGVDPLRHDALAAELAGLPVDDLAIADVVAPSKSCGDFLAARKPRFVCYVAVTR